MNETSGGKMVVLASADAGLRQRLRASLSAMRWNVREAAGGAEAIAYLQDTRPEALVMDSWLPDLEASEFAGQVRMMYPGVDVLRVDGDSVDGAARSPRRHELLHALREALEDSSYRATPPRSDGPAWASAPVAVPRNPAADASFAELERGASASLLPVKEASAAAAPAAAANPLPVQIPEMVGSSAPMLELARLIRLVAPKRATVLIEGETGTGKEVVASALHRLSSRSSRPFAVLNCAAIPEALLEAELFGHTRGAFTGAVTSRTGRIEAADGGTLFLDEIGEMPLALQAKMLRFLECGELQRVGENDVVRVDVRVIAATHQHLERRSEEGTFRLDLFHRLAVFPIEVPALRERVSDIPALAEFFLVRLGDDAPRKRIVPSALDKLRHYDWPGNVRELAHVLERAVILADQEPELLPAHIVLRQKRRDTVS